MLIEQRLAFRLNCIGTGIVLQDGEVMLLCKNYFRSFGSFWQVANKKQYRYQRVAALSLNCDCWGECCWRR